MEDLTYQDIFGIDPPPGAGAYQDAKHQVGLAKERKAIELRLQADINDMYADAIDRTIAETGHGSLYMANVHRLCAQRKRMEAELLFPTH